MADTIPATTPVTYNFKTEQQKQRWHPARHQLALAAIILVSVFMNFFQLGQGGFGTYYPAAVRSMMDNWHNFFFASYDPGGFVTIDKPPVGFWLEVASAKIFGFSPFSVLVPQALAGVLAVLLLYYLVRRYFGVAAGLLAALALALSPISIVTNRNITIDSTLALTLLVGAWAVLRAAETGKLRWLLLSAAIVGLGFNIKMMEAYLVVPAFGLLYLLAAPKSIWKRIGHLALAGILLLAISFSWALAVDLTPASQRPYVGSTQDNSEISLATGYNGIDRLFGRFGGGPGGRRNNTNTRTTNAATRPNATTAGTSTTNGTGGNTTAPTTGTPTTNAGSNTTAPAAGTPATNGTGGSANPARNTAARPPAGGFGGLFDTGNIGPLRLFSQPLASQIAWLLPLALLGLLACAWQRRPNFQEDRQQQSMILWGAWVLTMGAFFSVAGFFHQYYMTEMAPGIAALVGIGLVAMWQDYRRAGWKGWLLPLALIATVAEQVYILTSYPTWGRWMIPLMVVAGVLTVGTLLLVRIVPRLRFRASSLSVLMPVIGLGMLATLLAPTVWAAIPVLSHTHGDVLTAGPQGNDSGGFGGGGRDGNNNTNTKLLQYLEANQGQTKFLVAVPSSMTADGLILATNKPVMALGGFSGGDPILTTNQLATLVSNGTVRFFLLNTINAKRLQALQNSQQARNLPRGGFGGFGRGPQNTLTTWVTQHCTTVPTSLWQSSSPGASPTRAGSNGFASIVTTQLYDCAAAH
ncbi:MAG: glycosyltransferase family 39 protein [Chloroflexi bacterium]|nr:glycosyltransferase family 39 protein [Chloroflexota bacterium]